MKRTGILTALTACAALTLAGCGSGAEGAGDADGPATLNVGTIGIASDAALQVGIDKGYFKDAGVTIEKTVIANPPAGIAAAQSGKIDVTYTPSIPMLTAMSHGVPLQVVAAADGYPAASKQSEDLSKVDDTGVFVSADSSIDDAGDLVGKTVAVPARKAQMEVTIANSVREAGGDPESVKWMVLDFASALQSLNDGRVDAAALVSPFTSQAAADGDVRLLSPGVEFFKEGAVGLYVTGKSTAESAPDALAAFREGIYKANAYCNEHRPECEEVAAKVTKTPLKVIRSGAETYWPTEVQPIDLQRVNNKLVDLGYIKEKVDLTNVMVK